MADLRSLILNSKPKTEDVPTPFWSQKDENGVELVDGHIALQDIPSDDLIALQKGTAEGQDSQFIGSLLCKSLVDKNTGALIFQEADRDQVIHLGSTVLLAVFKQAATFFGINTTVEDTKKNSGATLNSSSGIEFQNAFIRP